MGHILRLDPSHFRTRIGSFRATNGQVGRYEPMAKQVHIAREAMMAHPHQIALPYRGDGVARALHDAFDPDDHVVPRDMRLLLAALDRSPVAAEQFDLIHDRLER
jgi:hypothetical protein